MKKKLLSCLSALVISLLLSTSVFSVTFVPSPPVDVAPSVIDASIVDKDGNAIQMIDSSEIMITALADASSTPKEIQELLKNATESLKDKKIGEVIPGIGDRLNEYSNQNNRNLSLDDIVVEKIFDITLTGNVAEKVKNYDAEVSITLDVPVDPNAFVAVGHYTGSESNDLNDVNLSSSKMAGSWNLLPQNQVHTTGEGKLYFTTSDFSPFAIIVERDTLAVAADAPLSPQTGDETSAALLLCAASLGAAAFVYFKNKRICG